MAETLADIPYIYST